MHFHPVTVTLASARGEVAARFQPGGSPVRRCLANGGAREITGLSRRHTGQGDCGACDVVATAGRSRWLKRRGRDWRRQLQLRWRRAQWLPGA